MKILAIRLNNLASLAGTHQIEFNDEPLASAGVFAITGPTGAGKSTLLDALCLALFGTTPRLLQAPSPQSQKLTDGDQLSLQDGRTLLRRGCASGYAEVDFTGVDGRPYRARWEVRRARDKANGRLQASQQSLMDLSDQSQLARTKNEFNEQLEQKLGLSRDQFTRAVLLAQNEFNAFLKAEDNERSTLLEKLTDTQLYTRLGMAAYQNTKAAEQRLTQLEQQLNGLPLLDSDSRQALEQAYQDCYTQRAQDQQQLEHSQRQQQWLSTKAQLQQQVQHSLHAQTQAEQQWQSLAELRQNLNDWQLIASIRPVLDRLSHLDSEQGPLRQQLALHQEQLPQRQQELKHAQDMRHNAQQAEHQALQTQQQAEPALKQLEHEEGQLHNLQQRLNWVQQHTQQLAHSLQHHQDQIDQHRQQLSQHQQQHAELEAQLQHQQRLEPLAAYWADRRPQLYQLAEQLRKQQDLDRQLPALEQAVQQAAQRLDEAQQQLQTLAQQANYPLQNLAQHLEILNQRQHLLLQLQHLGQQGQRLHQERQELLQQRQQSEQKLPQLEQDYRQLNQAYQQAEQEAQQLQRLLERQQLARSHSAEQLRAQLQSETPCPVCGSSDHPWRGVQQLLNQQEQQDSQTRDQAQAQLKSLDEQRRALQHELSQQQVRQAHIHERLAQIDPQWQELEQSLKQHPEYTCEQLLSQGFMSQLKQQLEHLGQEISTALTHQKAYQRLNEQHRQAQDQHQHAQRHLEQQSTQHHHYQQHNQQGLEQLAQYLCAEQHHAWQTQPQQAFEHLEQQVLHCKQTQQRYQDLNSRCQQLQESLNQHQQQQRPLEQQHQQHEQELAQLHQQLIQQRDICLNQSGSYTDSRQWRQQLQQSLDQARSQYHQAQQHLHQQQHLLDQLQHGLNTQQQRLEHLQQEQQRLSQQKAQWHHHHPELSHARLEQIYHLAPEQIAQWQQEVQHANEQYQQTQAQYQACQHQLVQHEALYAQEPNLDPQSLAEQINRIREQLKETEQQLIQHASRLEEDRRQRQQLGQLQQQIEAARTEYLRRARLSAVIGSADGAAFRKIAQAYNLDLLLQHANVQLRQLARRYRLQRGGSPLGLLIIDTDMGDECRSVHSLSGGESFLVSLALALGLASMASRNLNIESLFIDEGFGSLDPESLHIALDALDALQAQGRKVGIISHVQTLHERISVQIQVQPQGNGQSHLKLLP